MPKWLSSSSLRLSTVSLLSKFTTVNWTWLATLVNFILAIGLKGGRNPRPGLVQHRAVLCTTCYSVYCIMENKTFIFFLFYFSYSMRLELTQMLCWDINSVLKPIVGTIWKLSLDRILCMRHIMGVLIKGKLMLFLSQMFGKQRLLIALKPNALEVSTLQLHWVWKEELCFELILNCCCMNLLGYIIYT